MTIKSNNDTTPYIPHPLVIFAGNSTTILAQKIAAYADAALGSADVAPHPNGECMVKLRENVRERDVFVVQSICHQSSGGVHGYTGVNDMLMELLVMGQTLSLASAWRLTAVIPYFGYARQDRKAAGRTPISARLVCDLLQTAGYKRVITMDLHADQIQGFFDPLQCKLDHLNAGQLITDYFKSLDLTNAVLLCPDLGNMKKVDRYKRALPKRVGIAVIDKRRDSDTGKVTSERIVGDTVEGKTVLMSDDIISTAGTMGNAIDLALKCGAKEFYICATHGEFVGTACERFHHTAVKQIAVTNTIPLLPTSAAAAEVLERGADHVLLEDLPIKILCVGEIFGEAIRRVHAGESVSELLGIFG